MLLIYTEQITGRIRYTFNLTFRSLLGVPFELTTNPEEFKNYSGPKISYTKKAFAQEIFFKCSSVLFVSVINPAALEILQHVNSSVLPEDPFACIFLMVSRYEEYLPFNKDRYGRFAASQSIAFKNKFIEKPVVNIWVKEIQKTISSHYPYFIFPQKKYSYLPTIDIDNAYAYKEKGTLRTLGGYARAITKSDYVDFSLRRKVLSGKTPDPFDTYEFQINIHKKYNLKPVYFFLLGDWAEYDKNLPYTNTALKSIIRKLSDIAEIGIHPSFASNFNPEKVKIEKLRLEGIKNKSVTKSRQHFLILRFPETYRHLIEAEITDDYTMAYADCIGFRAGICSAYKWYDLKKDMETDLTIHPVAVMDGTLMGYMKLSQEEAIHSVKDIIHEIKNVNGTFITIWHNESLSNWRDWKGWQYIYEEIIKVAI